MHFITFSKGTQKIIVPILHIDTGIGKDISLYFWIYLFPVGYRIRSILCNNLCMGFFVLCAARLL